MASRDRLELLVGAEPPPQPSAASEDEREQMDFPDDAGLVGVFGFEFGEVDLGLLAGSGSSASDDEPGRRSGFWFFRVVRLFFVRGGAESVESLWTIPSGAVSGFRVQGLDCPHPCHPSACRRCICELALLGSRRRGEHGKRWTILVRAAFEFRVRGPD